MSWTDVDSWLMRMAAVATVLAVGVAWWALRIARRQFDAVGVQLAAIEADQRRIAEELERRPDLQNGLGRPGRRKSVIHLPAGPLLPQQRVAVMNVWVGNAGTRSATHVDLTLSLPDIVEPVDDPELNAHRRLSTEDLAKWVHRPEAGQWIGTRSELVLHPSAPLITHVPVRLPRGALTFELKVAADCTDMATALATILITGEAAPEGLP